MGVNHEFVFGKHFTMGPDATQALSLSSVETYGAFCYLHLFGDSQAEFLRWILQEAVAMSYARPTFLALGSVAG